MGNRRKSREAALQALYQIDLAKAEPEKALEQYWKNNIDTEEIQEFANLLVQGVISHLSELDQLIEKHSTHWKLSRMACVDRNILRMSAYELIHCKDIPASVSLNEAIEIGKKFGTEDSSSFINGILDNLAREIRPNLEN